LLHCRHYVRNYIDLIQDILARIYTAGPNDLKDPVVVGPGDTVGEVLNVTEERAAAAIVDESKTKSTFLELIRTIAQDQGTDSDNVESIVQIVSLNFTDPNDSLPTFAKKADAIEDGMAVLVQNNTISQSQLDQIVAGIRSFGQVVSDFLAFAFPQLDHYRINLTNNPEQYILVTGPYSAHLPADPAKLLTCSFARDHIELAAHIESFKIDKSTNFEFYKVKDNGKTKEKYASILNGLGAIDFDKVDLTLNLNNDIGFPATYDWAPGHEAERADWATASVAVSLSSVSLDLQANASSVLAAFYEGYWTVQGLANSWEQLIRDSIGTVGDLADVGKILREYVSPIARQLIPVAYAMSSVGYSAPFENEDITTSYKFTAVDATTETHSVTLMNQQSSDSSSSSGGEVPPFDPPDIDWKGPLSRSSSQPMDARQKAAAVVRLTKADGLTPHGRATAALSLEGLSPLDIGTLKRAEVDFAAGTVRGQSVDAGTLALLKSVDAEARAQGAGDYLLRYGGFTGRPALVRAELNAAARHVALSPAGGVLNDPSTDVIVTVPDLDPGIWRSEYTETTPLRTSYGSASDPCWTGLSTNCVLATMLYRRLRQRGLFTATGVANDKDLGKVHYEIQGCEDDVAADFSGETPGDAPGLVMAGLAILAGPTDKDRLAYRADVRVRLKPVIYSHGCLPDEAVTLVAENLDCLEGMMGADMPETTRLRQLAFRDFVFLSADIGVPAQDIEMVGSVKMDNGDKPADLNLAVGQIRAAIADWFPTVPEVPILYNVFRPVGGETRSYFCQGGWLALYRHYALPDFSDVHLG
jgi:hypothetical protein